MGWGGNPGDLVNNHYDQVKESGSCVHMRTLTYDKISGKYYRMSRSLLGGVYKCNRRMQR